MYKVFPHKKAVKYYESLDDKAAKRINKAIESMSKIHLKGHILKD
jgi:mRNA-degrading endonuclease RelE of RelBE toxin-antitoxin system